MSKNNIPIIARLSVWSGGATKFHDLMNQEMSSINSLLSLSPTRPLFRIYNERLQRNTRTVRSIRFHMYTFFNDNK